MPRLLIVFMLLAVGMFCISCWGERDYRGLPRTLRQVKRDETITMGIVIVIVLVLLFAAVRTA